MHLSKIRLDQLGGNLTITIHPKEVLTLTLTNTNLTFVEQSYNLCPENLANPTIGSIRRVLLLVFAFRRYKKTLKQCFAHRWRG